MVRMCRRFMYAKVPLGWSRRHEAGVTNQNRDKMSRALDAASQLLTVEAKPGMSKLLVYVTLTWWPGQASLTRPVPLS
jgi:hypothetical protein